MNRRLRVNRRALYGFAVMHGLPARPFTPGPPIHTCPSRCTTTRTASATTTTAGSTLDGRLHTLSREVHTLSHARSHPCTPVHTSGRYVYEVEEVLKKYPKLKFVWVHAGVSRR